MYLAINTCEASGELAVLNENKVLAKVRWEKDEPHSEVITERYLALKKSMDLNENELTRIICINGPGSFTGIRVGVNFTKALAYTFNIPVYSLSTLTLLALRCKLENKKIISCVDAQKNSVFISSFEFKDHVLQNLSENQIVEINNLDQLIKEPVSLCGSGLERYKQFIKSDLFSLFHQNEEWKISQLSDLLDFDFQEPMAWNELQPLYIKNSSAEEKHLQNISKT